MGSQGNDVYNTNLYDLEGMPRFFNAGTGVLNRWTGPGTSNSVPRLNTVSTENFNPISSRYIEDGSFTRLKNISLGYTFSDGAFTNNFTKLRVYVSGQNLITLTDYSGLDPEIGQNPLFGGGGNFELGIDRGTYPQPKSFLIGVELSF